LSTTRIVVSHMPHMLQDIIVAAIAQDATLELVERLDSVTALLDTAARTDADVLVTTLESPQIDDVPAVLLARPGIRVLAVSAEGGHGTLFALAPMAFPLGELSPDVLREALRG
jgi:AmiR/NasT family two-component response regulator